MRCSHTLIDCWKSEQVQARPPCRQICRLLWWGLLNFLLKTLNKSLRISPDTNSQAFNWSRNNFGEIHISQGLDWAFLSLPHCSLSVITVRTSNPVRLHNLWRFTSYLQEKDENSIVKQSLKISVDLYHNGENSFYSNLKKMTDYYDFPGFNCNLLNKCKITQYVDLMQNKYLF